MAPAPMVYRLIRALVSLVVRLFFRLDPPVDPHHALSFDGSVIFVGNHPNGLVDPAIVFALAKRQVTFLAKAPLFSLPVLGWLLKGVGALPVFRKQDGADTTKNEGVLSASVDALVAGRAISLFPEGKSHSEPQLAELKTGCARIALDAARRGAQVRIVPVGLTYAEKHRFRSHVHVDVGDAVEVKSFLEGPGADGFEAARQLTQAIADALSKVTLNLAAWEDLPIVQTAEALYALEFHEKEGDLERQRAFARGMTLLRDEEPERFEALKSQVVEFRRRLDLARVSPRELTFEYRPAAVLLFTLRNLVWLFGLPMFVLGMAVFFVPWWLPQLAVNAMKPEKDVEATVKMLTAMVLAPVWWALAVVVCAVSSGPLLAFIALLGVPALALFTRYFLERRMAALHDLRIFGVFWSRRRLKASLLSDGQALAKEIARLAEEYRPRVA